MEALWKKGDDVTIFQLSWNKGLFVEGRAKITKVMGGSNEHYMVRFYKKNGKTLERESYERFIDREGQTDPDEYIKKFNARIGVGA